MQNNVLRDPYITTKYYKNCSAFYCTKSDPSVVLCLSSTSHTIQKGLFRYFSVVLSWSRNSLFTLGKFCELRVYNRNFALLRHFDCMLVTVSASFVPASRDGFITPLQVSKELDSFLSRFLRVKKSLRHWVPHYGFL